MIYVNLAAIKFGVSPRPVNVVYDRRICWRRQILAKTRNSPNSPNIIARQNLLIYSNVPQLFNLIGMWHSWGSWLKLDQDNAILIQDFLRKFLTYRCWWWQCHICWDSLKQHDILRRWHHRVWNQAHHSWLWKGRNGVKWLYGSGWTLHGPLTQYVLVGEKTSFSCFGILVCESNLYSVNWFMYLQWCLR